MDFVRTTFAIGMLSASLSAQNLIQNPDFDKPMDSEIRFDAARGAYKTSVFTEHLTWNKALKLEVAAYQNNNSQFYTLVRFGGNDKMNGFPVKPNTIYSYSLEIRGTANANVSASEWTGKEYWKDVKTLKLSGITAFKKSDEWTALKGTFQTGPNAKWAALGVSLWGEKRYNNLPAIGSYVLIDRVKVEEKAVLIGSGSTNNRKSVGKKIKTALPGAAHGSFVNYKTGEKAKSDTTFTYVPGEKEVTVKVVCSVKDMSKLVSEIKKDGGSVWRDDSVEIFFSNGPIFRQFVLSSGGGRWAGRGSTEARDEYGKWSGSVTKGTNSWTAEFKIPYSLIGGKSDSSLFLAARNSKQDGEASAWVFARNGFHDASTYGAIFFSEPSVWWRNESKALAEKCSSKLAAELAAYKLTGDMTTDYAALKEFQRRADAEKFAGKTFVATRISPTSPMTIPFIPRELAAPSEKVTLRAAGNEYSALALAITNLLEKPEEYRIVIGSPGKGGAEDPGLKSASGELFPAENIKLLRGVRVKDGDEKTHGLMYDPLAPMDVTGTVIAMPSEAVPVWAVFNTTKVKPGVYKGFIRVIPLGQRASIDSNTMKYSGPMTDLPLEVEVLPFEFEFKPPFRRFFFQGAFGRDAFRMFMEYGVDSILLNTWGLRVSFNPDGSVLKRDTKGFEDEIRNLHEWAKEYGMEKDLKIGVVYSAYSLFRDVHGKKKFKYGTPEWTKAWTNFVRIIEDIRVKTGVPNDNFFVEISDEPAEKDMAELTLAAKTAHEAVPGLRFMLTLAAWDITPAKLEALVPLISEWCLWSNKFFTESKYANLMKLLREQKKTITFYNCEVIRRQDLYKYYRLHAWTAAARGLDGADFFQFMTYRHKTHDWKISTYGEVALMSGTTPISTIRQECMRIGVNDVKYLYLLRKLAENSKDAKLRAEALAFVKSNLENTALRNTADSKLADSVREKAIDMILKFKGKR